VEKSITFVYAAIRREMMYTPNRPISPDPHHRGYPQTYKKEHY